MKSSLAYHEPYITTIVTLCSFLLLLNIINYALDRIVYCGLVGQVLLGIAWGTPGFQWLERDLENAAMQLGYIGLLLIVYEGGEYVVLPLTLQVNLARERYRGGRLDRLSISLKTAFVLHTTILLALVVGGTYAGTSGLFAAYIAGASISWWDSEVPHPAARQASRPSIVSQGRVTANENQPRSDAEGASADRAQGSSSSSGMIVYQRFFEKAVNQILKPLFFRNTKLSPVALCEGTPLARKAEAASCPPQDRTEDVPLESMNPASQPVPALPHNASPDPKMPVSLYPACIMAFAMVARGEIGFLISALAESNGVLGRQPHEGQPPELFLVITWAIVLCTIGGPVCVGLLVKRVNKLEGQKVSTEGASVLGAWGVDKI
ncbi:hypothetical protein D7B24_005135 [Verticillium nonalfalfae]|uniref:Cation/H+ exchanger domain-containing protein n=1 Tax=Verticillium nonalfalfae TaxID=1051616 RepID=A0A3M9YF26_9PEZI|nr:uncharacterized protein D7B24_005135 [Verticillium nonalfalfae]RNJ58178.1 hypothetical protein D7B24_005135 [Verticillium nonalfalfae]